MTEFDKIVREYWGKKSDLSDEEIEGFKKLKNLIEKGSMSKKDMTATEIMFMERARYQSEMVWLMARALVKGRVNSKVLKHAEMVYHEYKDIYELKKEV